MTSQNFIKRIGLPLVLGGAFAAAVGGGIFAVSNSHRFFESSCRVQDPRTPETPSLLESIICDRPYRLIPNHDLPVHP